MPSKQAFLSFDYSFCVMAATFLSCLILLPRNMQEEAGYTRVNNVFVRQGLTTTRQDQPSYMDMHDGPPSYKSPVAESETPWNVLGDRLRLEKDDVRDMADGQRTADEEEAYEMPFARFGPSRRASVDTQRNVEARVVSLFITLCLTMIRTDIIRNLHYCAGQPLCLPAGRKCLRSTSRTPCGHADYYPCRERVIQSCKPMESSDRRRNYRWN